ncbi:hypothetical protein GMST_04470 [Geomonas silvestris]|uniref:ImpA N-terminal domain-containing protein n=1 Tax=Geomonas silvestris TaxID=2740184 RepID=A0A6V8MDU7_9BACT|nr:type VI secretion system protein TssA [Geomonas silvestris]GFO58122.1 hypothetical protein GMST_04470 [Geomonas silvestris]
MELELSQLSCHPIRPDAPAGFEVREDPGFEALQAEVEKLSAPAAAGPVDWPGVARLSGALLAEKTKDLLVASYLAVALVHTEGCAGCARGLTFYRELLEHFWEKLYPQKTRLRARLRALEWWVEKTLAALEQLGAVSWPAPLRDGVLDELTRLERLLHDQLEAPPSLAPLIDYFCSVELVTALEPAPQQIGRAEQVLEAAPPAPEGPASSAEGAQLEGTGSLEAALGAVSRAVFDSWQRDPAPPHLYRMRRQLAWSPLEELPPAEGRLTRIPPPPQALVALLEELQCSDEPEVLLKAAETRLGEYLFWLDLSFFAYQALLRLGDGYARAREAVRQETAFFVRRLPGLEELCFADGTPFASSATGCWLAQSAQSLPLPCGEQGPAETRQDPAPGAEQVRHLVQSGRLKEAIEQSQQKLKECGCGRERLLWRVTMAGMLMAAGQGRVALPYLEQVLEELDRHHLEEYEPELALNALELAWRAYREQPEPQARETASALLLRIGRLDLPEMLRLTNR